MDKVTEQPTPVKGIFSYIETDDKHRIPLRSYILPPSKSKSKETSGKLPNINRTAASIEQEQQHIERQFKARIMKEQKDSLKLRPKLKIFLA